MEKTFSDSFNARWLFETPMITGPSSHNPYEDLVYAVNANIESGYVVVTLSHALKKLITDDDIFYWVETDNKIDIISQLQPTPGGLFIELTGKNNNSTTYASDFYGLILNDANRLIFSGNVLSNEGFGIWKNLLSHGKKLFVYDTDNPLNRNTINSEEELNRFLGDTTDYKRYRYVLSESIKEHTSTVTSFDLLRTYNLTFGIQ
jgi:hypothetical protein